MLQDSSFSNSTMGLPPEDNSTLFCGRNLATTIDVQSVSTPVKCALVYYASLCIPLMVFDPADLWNHISDGQHTIGSSVYSRHVCRVWLSYDTRKLENIPREGVGGPRNSSEACQIGTRLLRWSGSEEGAEDQGVHVHRGPKRPRNEGGEK
jgi:hypothetical protein